MRKRIWSVLLVFCMVLTMVPVFTMQVEAETNGHSQDDAVSWAIAQNGKSLDYDGVEGKQCVDLIKYYYDYLGNASYAHGNANEYQWNDLPSGWTRVTSGFQPGDIAVFKPNYEDRNPNGSLQHSTGPNGHVAIITSVGSEWFDAMTQNSLGHSYVESMSYRIRTLSCAIRPDFSTDQFKFYVDNVSGGAGCISLRGWVYNQNNITKSIQVHAYIDGGPGSGAAGYAIEANLSRKDVGNAYNCGEFHGFDYLITGVSPGTHELILYANDQYLNQATVIGTYSVTVSADTQAPIVSNVKVTDLSRAGFTVSCTITDDHGLNRVQFPTWTAYNGQDDIQPNWNTSSAASGTIRGSTVTYRVNTADHNNETGLYTVHIYAFDNADNQAYYQLRVNVSENGEMYYEPIDTVVFNGHTYLLFNDDFRWCEAAAYCQSIGGYLTSITSEAENVFLANLLSANSVENVWIGANDLASEGTFVWDNGEPFSYANWREVQPNNYNDQDAVRLNQDGYWDDYFLAPDYRESFICEIDHVDAPVIKSQPEDAVVANGKTAVFSVTAEGEGLTYQWQISDDGGKTWSNSSVKNPKYSTKMTAAKDGRMVRCIVSDQYGNSVTSDAATMKMAKLLITASPQDYMGKLNSTAKFTVSAQGDGLTYQWQTSSDGGKTWSNSSVKNASYSTKLTSGKDGRMVRCIVSDQYGNTVTSGTATMKVYQFAITTQPQNYVGKVNSSAKFTVIAVGDGLTYQWQYSDNGTKWSNSSVKSAVYTTKLTSARDGRYVRCIVTDCYGGKLTSNPVTMKIG